MGASRRSVPWLVAVAIATVAIRAHADDLVIETLELGGWNDAVAAMQRDLGSEGRTVHVVVRDASGERASCGDYTLDPDAVTSSAFTMGRCDPSTNATPLTLTRRIALFTQGALVREPARAELTVRWLRQAHVSGQATVQPHGELNCAMSVRPTVRDLYDGRVVPLSPDRYVLVVLRADAHTDPASDGWNVRVDDARGDLDVSYEVHDRTSGAVVLREVAHLTCVRRDASASAPDPRDVAPTESLPASGDTIPPVASYLPRVDAYAPYAPVPSPRYGPFWATTGHRNQMNGAEALAMAGVSVFGIGTILGSVLVGGTPDTTDGAALLGVSIAGLVGSCVLFGVAEARRSASESATSRHASVRWMGDRLVF